MTTVSQNISKTVNSFKTTKFKKAMSMVSTIVEKQLFTPAYFVVSKTLYQNLYTSYVKFLDSLKKFETDKSKKVEAKEVLKQFLTYYTQANKELTKVVKKEKININWTTIKLDKVSYKNEKLGKVVNNTLDNLIIKELRKPKYTKQDITIFTQAYNNFKLVVKYMKETNKTEGKKLAKEYVKEMLAVLKK